MQQKKLTLENTTVWYDKATTIVQALSSREHPNRDEIIEDYNWRCCFSCVNFYFVKSCEYNKTAKSYNAYLVHYRNNTNGPYIIGFIPYYVVKDKHYVYIEQNSKLDLTECDK